MKVASALQARYNELFEFDIKNIALSNIIQKSIDA